MKKKYPKRYNLTLDKIREMVYCVRDNWLNEKETETYLRAFLRECEQRNRNENRKGKAKEGA